jgi:hypothetical protein
MPDEGLSALSMQVGMAIEHIRAMDRELEYLRMWRRRTDQRLEALETHRKRPRLAGLAREVASPREWSIGLAIALLAIWGILSPEDVRDKIRDYLDLPPLNRLGPG